MNNSQPLGSRPIGPLLASQAIPASVGILIMSIYGIVDTIFVGRFIGTLAIGAITVILPITFLIASIGMAIGIGGASIISRALGAGNPEKAHKTFGNQLTLTLSISFLVVLVGSFFQQEILMAFGGKGDILPYAEEYFAIILVGVPFLAIAMMCNNVIRAEGEPKIAMFTLIIPAVANMILDPILIVGLEMGIAGAAWATTLSYIASATYGFYFFTQGRSELRFSPANLRLKYELVKEIFAIGSVTLARQGTISVLAIILNNSLFKYGGEMSVSVYGIINRLMMFANFPVLGMTQGFLPIAGFNYGAQKWGRVRKVVQTAILWGTGIALCTFLIIICFPSTLSAIFTTDEVLISETSATLVKIFLATPLIAVQLIGSAYFQAIGKALPALLLTLTKQGFFLIPLLLILPPFYGLDGIWYAFPIADVGAASICLVFLIKGMNKLKTNPENPLQTA